MLAPSGVVFAGLLLLAGCTDRTSPTDDSERAATDAVSPAQLVGVGKPDDELGSAAPGQESQAVGLDTMMRQAAEAEAAGDSQRMVDKLELAIEAYPSAPGPRIALGSYYMLRQDSASALALLDEFSRSAEQTPALLGLYGAAQVAEGQYLQARETLESLREIQPDNPAVHYQLSKIYAHLGEYDLVEPSLDRAIELNPNSIEAHIARARFYLLRGNREAVAEEIILLKELAPEHPGVVNLVTVQEQQEALTKDSGDLQAAMDHAMQLIAAGDLPGAMSGYRAVLEVDPENIEALNNLAWFSRDVDPPAALAYAREATSLAPESPLVLDTLAMVLMANQRTDEAVETIQAALELAPEESGILLHGALILHKAGDTDRARQILEKLANSGEDSVEKSQARRLLEALDSEAAPRG